MNSKNIVVIVAVVVLIILGAFIRTRFFPSSYTYQGSLIDPALPAMQFELSQANGDVFKLADQQGKVVLIFFGYANCPDVCPATLAEFKQVYETLGDQADQVKFVFITIDPERDTLDAIESYVHAFNPNFVGLSGTENELQPVWDAFFVYREKVETDSALDYEMNHSTRVIVIDKNGNFRMTFPYGMAPQAMADDVVHLLSE